MGTTLLAINNQSHTHSYYLTLYNQINLVGKNRFRFVVKLYKIFYIVKMYNLWKGIKKQGKHRLLRLCLTRKISDVPTIKSICSLPSEVLEHVFKFLPKKDMLTVVLVCRWWREVGERPQFWSSCKIVVSRRGELDMFRSRRFQFLQNIIVGGYWWETQLTFPQVETIFNELLISTNLTHLNISSNFLSTILPMTLATVITEVQVVNVCNCALTEEQVLAVFETMNEGMCLKELNIAWNNLITQDANILATGVNKLRSLDISRTNVTVTQVDQIFREAAKGTHLRTLSHDQELVGQINP